jgi:hypothetical protein
MRIGVIDSGQKIITDGLVLHLDAAQLRSYPGTGTTWTNIAASGNNGTLINGPTFNSGNGGSILFDGTNDYVDCGVLNNTQELTLAGWFLHPASTFQDYNALINKDSGGANRIYQITLEGGKLQQHLNTPTGARITAVTAIPTNTWLYYTYTSTASGNLGRLYQNAVSVGTGVAINASSASIPLLLHAYNGTGVSGTMQIATTQVYNRALSATEVLQNFNAVKSRFGL